MICKHDVLARSCYICDLEAEVALLNKYAGFLRSVIRSGERLPDDYSIADFERRVPVYGSPEFPYVYHEDRVDGRTLIPESVARNLRS